MGDRLANNTSSINTGKVPTYIDDEDSGLGLASLGVNRIIKVNATEQSTQFKEANEPVQFVVPVLPIVNKLKPNRLSELSMDYGNNPTNIRLETAGSLHMELDR